MHPKMYNLAKLYHLTGDKEAGRRALVIVNAYADRWPQWLYNQHYGHGYGETRKDRLMGWGVMTREGRRAGDERNGPMDFMNATDLLMGTEVFKAFAKEKGINLKDKLWNNVIKMNLDRAVADMTYPDVMLREYGQACPVEYVELAKVFNSAELIRNATIKALPYTPRMVMGIDGSFIQGTGYCQIHYGAMSKMHKINGYSDPDDFVVPEGEEPVKNFRYPTGAHEDYWMKAYNDYMRSISMPDGGAPAVNDSEHQGYIPFIPGINVPLRKSRDQIKHGYKYAILGDGDDDEQIQLHLNYSPNFVGHGAGDSLELQLFAFGHYLMDDNEYCKNQIRVYSGSTPGHNTVVVDYKNQGDAQSVGGPKYLPYQEGSPKLYDGRTPGLSVISVDAARAYLALGVRKYQRTMLLNTYELKRPYIVDVFQVKGGKVRDYMLRGNFQHPTTGTSNFKLTQMPGETPLMPEFERGKLNEKDMGSGYRLFFDVSEGSAEKGGVLDYTVKEPWKPRKKISSLEGRPALTPYKVDKKNAYPGDPPVGTRHHVVGNPGQKVFMFESPDMFESVYKIPKGYKYEEWKRTPHMMLRYEVADENQETAFVVVHEPWVGKAHIKSVKKLDSGNENLLALEIEFDDRTDTVFFSLSGNAEKGKAKGAEFDGRVGCVADKKGKVESYLLGGTKLAKPSAEINLTSSIDKVEGEIIRSYRKWYGDEFDGFAVKYSGELPDIDDLRGSFAVVANTGRITNLKPENFINPGMAPRFYSMLKRSLGTPHTDLAAIYAKKDERQYEKYEGYVATAKKLQALLESAGGGWGFIINRVVKKDDYLIIVTEQDHGLDIKEGKTEEFCFPMRHFETPNTLKIYPSESSQRAPQVIPAGGAFMRPVNFSMKSAVPGHELYYAVSAEGKQVEPVWHRYGKPIVPEELMPPRKKRQLIWKKYTEPFAVKNCVSIMVKAIDPKGIREQLPEEYHFVLPEKLVEVTPETLKPGVKRVIRKCNLDRKKMVKPEDYGVVYASADEMYTLGDTLLEDISLTIDESPVIENATRKRISTEMTLDGYLKISEPGVYKIYYRPHQDGSLDINGKTYVYSRFQGGTPMPYSFEIPLEQGYVPFHLVYRCIDSSMREGHADLEFEWVKPDGKREFIPGAVLFHQE